VRVLQLSKFFPPIFGGIETVTWELAEGLHAAGAQVEVLCSNQAAATVRERASAGYRIVRAGSWGQLLSTSMAPPMVGELLRRRRAHDLIHVHMPDPMAAAALWTARPTGRVVVHWHSDVIRQRRALALYRPLQDWLLARADAVIATSDAYAAASQALLPWRGKVAVVPIGMSDNRSEACRQRAADVQRRLRGRRIVFALGRMTYYKGFGVLIEAARRLPEDCAVIIGGDGDLLEDYRHQVARAGLSGKVHLPGHIPDDELASYFHACDVFCMPSTLRAEAYGVAMVEAMAVGRPVVASDISGSGVPWVNQHGRTGLNVAVGDAGALAAALTRLLTDEPLRLQLAEGARRRYEEEFAASRMTQRVMELYRRLLHPNGSR
jgi:glycosyltransferase involved in cell wall biosynthesis